MQRVQHITAHLVASSSKDNGVHPEVLFVANRGIPALRVIRTAKRLGFRVVGGYCLSDSKELFVKALDEAVLLDPEADGPGAYTNVETVIQKAKELKAQFVHPGIGFLSESGEFAKACANAGLVFVGPSPECLDLFGNKLKTCNLATTLQVPNLALGTVPRSGELTPEQKARLPVLLKATNGGGGLGLRLVQTESQAKEMYERCLSEAKRAFASDDDTEICAEIYLPRARHVEVQLVGDGTSFVCLGDRECTVQRKFQKMVEVAPCPALDQRLRKALADSAVKIAQSVSYRGVGTFEFLIQDSDYYFIECNPRLQVEHTVTEQVFRGLDLVATQLRIAQGMPLTQALPSDLKLQGCSIQMRICSEQYSSQGQALPVPPGSRIRVMDLPRGEIRVETLARSGYTPNSKFDSLLAQLIVFEQDFQRCCNRCIEVLQELRLVGCPTNIALLEAIVSHPRFRNNDIITAFFDQEFSQLRERMLQINQSRDKELLDLQEPITTHSDKSTTAEKPPESISEDGKTLLLSSPMQAHVVSVFATPGLRVEGGRTVLFVLSALKMEHEIRASKSGIVSSVNVKAGDQVEAGTDLGEVMLLDAAESSSINGIIAPTLAIVKDATQSDVFKTFYEKVEYSTKDASRLDKTGARLKDPIRLTSRQILDQIFDEQTLEYGRLASNGYQKHSVGDGLYVVKGTINARALLPERPKALVLTYDYTVLAGTQGLIGHKKKDRAFTLALKERLPIVLFAEGGGGRAGDARAGGFTSSGLDGPAFTLFAKLAAVNVPLIGAVSGFCFAGNAALLGTCDVIIATKNVSLGMGGPAMIEGGGLGIVKPEDVGPVDVHFKRGVVDLVVENDEEMVRYSQLVLSYFQGRIANWKSHPESPEEIAHKLRNLVPTANRRLAFTIMTAIKYVFDFDSVVELKSAYARNLITCFARLEGKPVGVLANDCRFVSGTLDAHASRKAADFLRLCSRHQIPLVVFCDTPGFLVGVESEKESLVKRAGELFVAGASITVPLVVIVVRRCVGLGGQAMCCGDLKVPNLTVAWPTGEFGAMGFEGAVKLGFRNEIKEDPALFDKLVAAAYENGKALHVADHFEIDDVIDPADTRKVVRDALFYSSAM